MPLPSPLSAREIRSSPPASRTSWGSARRTGFRSGSRQPFSLIHEPRPPTETETPHTETATPDTDSASEINRSRCLSLAWRRPLTIGVDRPRDRPRCRGVVHDQARTQTPSPSNARAPPPRHPHQHAKSSLTVAATPRPEPTPSRVERPGSRRQHRDAATGDRAERAVVHGARETRVTRLAMHVSGR